MDSLDQPNTKLYIFKTGDTFPEIKKQYGDCENWIERGLGLPPGQVAVHDARTGDFPPDSIKHIAGIIITGSHSMVSDREPWSEALVRWLVDLQACSRPIPVLGICYGHQLLAHAFGGKVDFHPKGIEIGTVRISLTSAAYDDFLFKGLPSTFPVNVSHRQTVLQLPPAAVKLAFNAFEPTQAFRFGACVWGVQFHPEFDINTMQGYINCNASGLERENISPKAIAESVTETLTAASILPRFAQFCLNQQ